MIRRLPTLLLLACFASAFFPAARDGWPQERDPLLDKILNPLPDYNPFDQTPTEPQFFPDDVEKRARQVLVESLIRKDASLESQLQFFRDADAKLKKEHGSVTGLTGPVLDLSNNAIQDRARYLEAQRKALGAASTPEEKQLIEWRLRGDDLTQGDALLRKNTTNQWGGVLNRMLSSIDVVNIVSGSYVGAAVDSTISELVALTSTDMPLEKRKALALYQEHLKRYPDDPQNGDIQKKVEALEKEKKKFLVQKQLELAKQAAGKGDVDRAALYYEIAAAIDPAARDAAAGLEQLQSRLQQKDNEQKKALTVSGTGPAEAPKAKEDPDLRALLDALILRDQDRIGDESRILQERYRGQALADSAKDASAVALEMRGQHDVAKQLLGQIAGSANDPGQKERAASLLQSPEYNLLGSFEDARSQRRLETVKFVLLGDDFLKKNLLYSAAPLIAGGPAGATSVAALNVIMIGSNLYQVLTNNPVSSQDVVDKGVAYVRSHPDSKSATDVYKVLAQAYEENGRFDRALAYYQMAGVEDEKKFSDLKDKAAKAILQAAERSPDREVKESYLKLVAGNFPQTPAAQEATQKLSALAKVENQGLRMSKQFLMENPELYGAQGLRLKASLFDGNVSNMELADRGVNVLDDGQILLHYQTPWGVRSQSYALDADSVDRLRRALRQKNFQVALADAGSRDKGSPGGLKNLPLSLVQGGAELKGRTEAKEAPAAAESAETTLTLVREANGSYSKVLDYQLLSDNETDPAGKYKLPPISGSISAHGLSLTGGLPAGLWGDRLTVGTDQRSPYAGVQLPIPLLQGFIPVDFMLQGRPGRFSVFPKIHLSEEKTDDKELYR